jgi:hypothetical protein
MAVGFLQTDGPYPFCFSVPIKVLYGCAESPQFKLQDESKEHSISLQVGSVDIRMISIINKRPHFYSSNVCPLNPGRLSSNTTKTQLVQYCYKFLFLYQ